jgi:DNA invertase Pin-like site-specific DNA recombinase
MGRNLRDVVNIMHDFGQGRIKFRSLTEEINTSTIDGTLLVSFIAAIAQDEDGVILERTHAGIANARKRGVEFGRKLKLSKQQLTQAIKLMDSGERAEEVASSFRVSKATLYREIAKVRGVMLPAALRSLARR